MDIEPIKDKGKTQPYLESCLALAFEIESVFAKPVADPTNSVTKAHPTYEKMTVMRTTRKIVYSFSTKSCSIVHHLKIRTPNVFSKYAYVSNLTYYKLANYVFF